MPIESSSVELTLGLGGIEARTKSLYDLDTPFILSERSEGMGIYAAYLPDGVSYPGNSSDKPQPLVNNRRVVRDSRETDLDPEGESAGADTRLWVCSPATYWPYGGHLSLFAYAPYDETAAGDSLRITTAYASNAWPALSFTVRKDPRRQVDLLGGVALDKTSGGDTYRHLQGSVDLSLHHLLTWVDIRAKGNSEKAGFNDWMTANFSPSPYVGISSIRLDGILDSRTGHYASTGFNWDDIPAAEDYAQSYELSFENGHFKDLATAHLTVGTDLDYQQLLIGDGDDVHGNSSRLFLMPQELSLSATMTVEYGIFTSPSSGVYTPALLYQASFPIGNLRNALDERINYTWGAGKHVVYELTLNMSEVSKCTVTATVSDWEAGYEHEHDKYLE